MIKFPCKCSHLFNLTEDQAGGLVQCPRCSLLVDVPTLNDLANMNADDTFEFQNFNTPVDKTTAVDLHDVFTIKTTDRHGREKDLRPTAERYESIGLQDQVTPRVAPRYDPVAGELIRPMQFKDEQPVPVPSIAQVVEPAELGLIDASDEAIALPVIPISGPVKPGAKLLAYAMGETRKQVTLKTVALELLMPANSVVMFFVFVLFIAAFYVTGAVATYSERFVQTVWPFLIVNLPMWFIVCHVGCVIEDIGPNAIDELPRPFRNFDFADDLFNPLFRVLLSILVCCGPMAFLYHSLNPANPMTVPIVLIFAAGGIYLFPAVLLTAVAGTTVLNITPGRIAGVIRHCGFSYQASVLLFLIAGIPCTYYLAGELLFRLMFSGPFFQHIDSPNVLMPMTLLSVYMLHFFCWHMGMMYRANHERFPWIAQRHIKRNLSQNPNSRSRSTAGYR